MRKDTKKPSSEVEARTSGETIPSIAHKAYWAEGEVAKRLGVSVQLLRKQRSQGTGIRYHRFGKAIRYRISDVIEYEERCAERFIGQHKSNPSLA